MGLAPQERDVHTLLRAFLRKVDAGQPPRYATFRDAWQELHFSLIYEVHSLAPHPGVQCSMRILLRACMSLSQGACCQWSMLRLGVPEF